MKRLISILLVLIAAITAQGQGSVSTFGAYDPTDTSWTGGQIVAPAYANTNAILFFTADANGHFILDTVIISVPTWQQVTDAGKITNDTVEAQGAVINRSFISKYIATFGGAAEDTFNAYPVNVYGKIKTSSLLVDSFGAAPGSGDGGHSILLTKGKYYSPSSGRDSFLTNSARGVRDRTTVSIFNPSSGYASFDSRPVIYADDTTGVGLDHIVSFQGAPIWDYPLGCTINDIFGHWSEITAKNGTATNIYDFYASHLGATGTPATVTNHIGFYAEDFSGGATATNNHGFYSAGATDKNYFAGTLIVDSATKVNSKLIAKRIGVGTDNPTADASVQAFTGDTGIVTIEGGYPNLKFRWQYPPTNDSSEYSVFIDNQVYHKITEAGSTGFNFLHGSSNMLRLLSDGSSRSKMGIGGITTPRAWLEIPASDGVYAPLILNAGTLLSDAAAHTGTIQNDGNYLYYTNNGLNRGKVQVNKVQTSSAATLTLGNVYSHFVFTGTTTTWTLPAVTGTKDISYYIKNRGSGTITLVTTGATNTMYYASAINSFTVNPGEDCHVLSDGSYWLVSKPVGAAPNLDQVLTIGANSAQAINTGKVTATVTADNTAPTAIKMVNNGAGSSTGNAIEFPFGQKIVGQFNPAGITYYDKNGTDNFYVSSSEATYSKSVTIKTTLSNGRLTLNSENGASADVYIKSANGLTINTFSGGSFADRFRVSADGAVTTAQPTASGAGAFKIGKILTGSDTNKYLEVEIDGVDYYIRALTALP